MFICCHFLLTLCTSLTWSSSVQRHSDIVMYATHIKHCLAIFLLEEVSHVCHMLVWLMVSPWSWVSSRHQGTGLVVGLDQQICRDMDKVHLVRLISQGGVRIQLIIEQLGVPCAALYVCRGGCRRELQLGAEAFEGEGTSHHCVGMILVSNCTQRTFHLSSQLIHFPSHKGHKKKPNKKSRQQKLSHVWGKLAVQIFQTRTA